MLEGDRSRLYDWLCEETDERLAEYVVSRLSTVPLDELATKNDIRRLETDVQRVETAVVRLADLREADRAEATASRDPDRGEATALRDADRAERVAERAADRAERVAERASDRAEAKSQFRWLVGIVVSFGVSILVAVVAPMAVSLVSG
ncbi:hypothetical protein [Candidatus Poriferisodalis sp.]|uniref:hypothetical protein n=1 Tax=Candidatus Poriferisodalis sp. TaxID=3101277 RepID=UPI003B516E20